TKAAAIDFLNKYARHLWPKAATAASFQWDLLMDSQGRRGATRFDSQYWVANIDPSERYVLAAPGNARVRLRPNESGFKNLFLAGDWTRNGLSVGCVESAVMSGMQASRAISGYPKEVAGEHDFPPDAAQRPKRRRR